MLTTNNHPEDTDLVEIINLIDPVTIIPIIEKGIEIERLQLIADPKNQFSKDGIRNTRVLLSFLYTRKLGL